MLSPPTSSDYAYRLDDRANRTSLYRELKTIEALMRDVYNFMDRELKVLCYNKLHLVPERPIDARGDVHTRPDAILGISEPLGTADSTSGVAGVNIVTTTASPKGAAPSLFDNEGRAMPTNWFPPSRDEGSPSAERRRSYDVGSAIGERSRAVLAELDKVPEGPSIAQSVTLLIEKKRVIGQVLRMLREKRKDRQVFDFLERLELFDEEPDVLAMLTRLKELKPFF